MAIFLIFVSIILVLVTSSLLSLLKNIRSARRLGLPIIICPFNIRTIFWPIRDNAVGSNGCAGGALSKEDFIKPPEVYAVLDIFGRNVDTVNGDEWARHRKITAPCFNKTVSRSVWDEARRQAKDMLASWMMSNEGVTPATIDDTRTLALHVLSAAGFGVKQDFKSGMQEIQAGNTLNYRDALVTILNNVVVAAALPLWFLELSILPARLQKVSVAMKEFKYQMNKMIQDNRQTFAKGQTSLKPSLLSTLIRCSDEERSPRERLTDDEIVSLPMVSQSQLQRLIHIPKLGNFFIFNVAGHDTTANTLAYAITLISLNPHVQTWLAQELDHVFSDQRDGSEEPSYEQTFPRLKRCLAVMYETIRLYGPVIYIPRKPQNSPTLNIASVPGGELQLPDNIYVTVNTHAIHTNPETWAELGRPALEFWPQRWIEGEQIDGQNFVHREAGIWLGWSMGPRTCPRMKFSEVEFVAALSTLFAKHRVSTAVPTDKLRKALADSGIQGVTLCMKKKEDVVLKWQRVEK